MTRVTRRWLATLALIAGVGVLPLQDATTQTMRRAPAVEVEHAQIYLIRGLFGVFSSGMDQMAAQLKAQGYSNVSLWSWTDVDQIAADIISGHQNGDNAHVILIGHSLGSNAVVQVADRIGGARHPGRSGGDLRYHRGPAGAAQRRALHQFLPE